MTTQYPSDREKDGTPAATPEGSGKMARKLIGQILMEKGYATLEQVYEARRVQMNTKALPFPPLGMILREMGYATGKQIEEALRLQAGKGS